MCIRAQEGRKQKQFQLKFSKAKNKLLIKSEYQYDKQYSKHLNDKVSNTFVHQKPRHYVL